MTLMGTIHELVDNATEQWGDNTAAIYDDGEMISLLTYKEMKRQALQITECLGQGKVEENEIICICLPMSVRIPAYLLGILQRPAAFFYINPDDVDHPTYYKDILRRLHVRFMIVDSLSLLQVPWIQEVFPEVIPSPNLIHHDLVFLQSPLPHRPPCSTQLAYAITTSGTTGVPKLIRVPHQCIVPNLLDFRRLFAVEPHDRVFCASPLTFDPSIVEIFTSLISGAAVVMTSSDVKVSPEKLLKVLYHRQQVTILQVTPTLISRFKPDVLRTTLLGDSTKLRVLALGGEAFPDFNTISSWRGENNSTKFFNLYGITEVSSWASCYEVPDVDLRNKKEGTMYNHEERGNVFKEGGGTLRKEVEGTLYEEEKGEQERTVHLGDVLSDTILEVRDSDGMPVLEGVGELFIGGRERVCLVDEEEVLGENVMRATGDVVQRLLDGRLVYCGRRDRQVKRHGKRINLAQVEIAATKFPEVQHAVAVFRNNMIYLFVLGKTEDVRPHLSAFLRGRLPGHSLPDIIMQVEELPTTKHGKVDQRKLMESVKECVTSGLPATSAEDILKDILGNLRDFSDVQTFTSLGGNSVQAVHFIGQVEEKFSIKLPNLLEDLLSKPLKDILDFIDGEVRVKLTQASSLLNSEGNSGAYDEGNSGAYVEGKVRIGANVGTNRNGSLIRAGTKRSLSSADHGLSKGIRPEVLSHAKCQKFDQNRFVNVGQDEGFTNSSSMEESDTFVKGDFGLRKRVQDFSGPKKPAKRISNTSPREDSDTFVQTDRGLRKHIQACSNPRKKAKRISKTLTADAKFGAVPGTSKTRVAQSRGSLSEILRLTTCSKCTELRKGCSYSVQRGCKYFVTYPSYDSRETLDSKVYMYMYVDMPDNSVEVDPCSSKLCDSVQDKSRKLVLQLGNGATDHMDSVVGGRCSSGVSLAERWRYDTRKCVDASPVIVTEGRGRSYVYIGSHSHKFYAICLDTGASLWVVTLGDRIESSACLSTCGKFIIVGCYDYHLYILDRLTGATKWKYQTGSEVKSSPLVHPETGSVYFGAHDHCIYSLNIQQEVCEWQTNLKSGSIFSSVCLSPSYDQLYVATLGGHIFALEPESGDIIWKYGTRKPIFSSPAATNDGLIVGCVDGCIYCVNRKGILVWTLKTGAPIFSSPCLLQHTPDSWTAIVGSHDHSVYCFNQSGETKWTFTADSPVYSTPFIFRHKQSFRIPQVEMFGRESVNTLKNVVDELDLAKCKKLKSSGSHKFAMETLKFADGESSENLKFANSGTGSSEMLKFVNSGSSETLNVADRGSSEMMKFADTCSESSKSEDFRTVCSANMAKEQHSQLELEARENFERKTQLHEIVVQTSEQTESAKPEIDLSSELTQKNQKCSENESEVLEIVCVCSTKGSLYLLNLSSGSLLYHRSLPGEVFSSPVYHEGRIIVGCRDDYVYAFDIQ